MIDRLKHDLLFHGTINILIFQRTIGRTIYFKVFGSWQKKVSSFLVIIINKGCKSRDGFCVCSRGWFPLESTCEMLSCLFKKLISNKLLSLSLTISSELFITIKNNFGTRGQSEREFNIGNITASQEWKNFRSFTCSVSYLGIRLS